MTVVEDTCDLLVPVVVTCVPFELVVDVELWPTIDPESVPPNTKTIEPKPKSKTVTTAATGLFKPSPLSENVRTCNSLSPVCMKSLGNNDLPSNLQISVVVVPVDAWLRESVAPAFVLLQ
jgi:hypothetical protein